MNKNLLAVIIVGLICLGLGGLIGYQFALNQKTNIGLNGYGPNGQYQNTYADGWRAAKEYLKISNFFPAMGTVKILSGAIKKVDSNSITIGTALLNPLDDENLKTRKVLVSGDTLITTRRVMTAQEIAQSEKERQDKINNLKKEIAKATDEAKKIQLEADLEALKNIVAVDSTKEEKISLQELKAGQFVMVEAGEDISAKLEFTAIKISLQGIDIAGAPGAPVGPAAGGAPAPGPAPGLNDKNPAPSGPAEIPGPGI